MLLSTILNCSQSALHVTDDSCMKGVLQLTKTAAIVVDCSAEKKNQTPKV